MALSNRYKNITQIIIRCAFSNHMNDSDSNVISIQYSLNHSPLQPIGNSISLPRSNLSVSISLDKIQWMINIMHVQIKLILPTFENAIYIYF